MKGIILVCIEELVVREFGTDTWESILTRAGMEKGEVFFATTDYEEETTIRIVDAICKQLSLTLQEVADVFGDYWINQFAPKVYSVYYLNATSAKDFLLRMSSIHEKTTRIVKNAHPPVFEYRWKDSHTLIMRYMSKRDMVEFAAGLIRGVGRYFNEEINVKILGRDTLEVTFL